MSNEWYKRLIEAEAELNKYKWFFDYIESLIKTYKAVMQKNNPSINKIHDYNNALIHDIRNALEEIIYSEMEKDVTGLPEEERG